MANDTFTPSPIELAPGIGDNNGLAVDTAAQEALDQQTMDQQALDPQGYAQQQQQQQFQDTLNEQNATSPTPLGRPVTPSIVDTLNGLGKVEQPQVPQPQIANSPAPAPVDTSQFQLSAQGVPQVAGMPQKPGDDGLGGYRKQIQAANSVADATIAKSVADQKQQEFLEGKFAEEQIQIGKRRETFKIDQAQKENERQQKVADYQQAAGEKVVPGQIIADMSTGQKLQSGIFMALSAYGSALSGQENQALKVINNAISMDLDAQKYNLENKLKGARMGVESSQYILAQMRETYKDDETAALAAQHSMLQMVQARLNSNASKFDETTAKPKAMAVSGQIQVQMDALKQQMQARQAQATLLNSVSGGGTRFMTTAQLLQMKAIDKDFPDKWVQGYGAAANPEQGKKFIEYTETIIPAIDGLERVREMAKTYNKLSLTKENLIKRKSIEAEVASLIGALRVPTTGPGVLTDSEKDLIKNDVIGNPTKILAFKPLQMAALETSLNKMKSDLASRGMRAGLPESSFEKPSKRKYFND